MPKEKSNRNGSADLRCPDCASTDLVVTTVDYSGKLPHEGRLVSFETQAIEIPICQQCGSRVFTESVVEQINEAFRKHLKLLTPREIREGIQTLGMSQKALAHQLGVAEVTLSRLINNVNIQSRAIDNLLRLYFQLLEVRAALATGFKSSATIAATQTCSAGHTLHSEVSWLREFLEDEDVIRFENGVQKHRTTWGAWEKIPA